MNITKATTEVAVTTFNTFPIGDLNNSAIEMIKTAPVKPIPKIEVAKTLFIKSPHKYLKQATTLAIPPAPSTAYAPIHVAHMGQSLVSVLHKNHHTQPQ